MQHWLSLKNLTGGYLLEQDMRLDEDNWFYTKAKLPITIKSPEDITQAQLSYIKNYMQEPEDAIFSADFADTNKGYNKYINNESFIHWFIVQEIMKNEDAKEKQVLYTIKIEMASWVLVRFGILIWRQEMSTIRFPAILLAGG